MKGPNFADVGRQVRYRSPRALTHARTPQRNRPAPPAPPRTPPGPATAAHRPRTRTQPPPAAQTPAHHLHAPGLRAAQDSSFLLCSAGFRDPQWIGSAPTREWIALATRSSAPTAPKSKRTQKKKSTSQKVPGDHPEPVQPSPHAHRKKISSGRNPDHSAWSEWSPQSRVPFLGLNLGVHGNLRARFYF